MDKIFPGVHLSVNIKMTQYDTLNVKLSNAQLNKLKSAIKNKTRVTLKLSANIIGDSNDGNNFPHKLLLTDTQVSRLRKAFVNNSSINIKLSKTQLHKIGKSGGFLGRRLGPILNTGLPLIGNALNIIKTNGSSISIRRSYSKENLWIRNYNINNSK